MKREDYECALKILDEVEEVLRTDVNEILLGTGTRMLGFKVTRNGFKVALDKNGEYRTVTVPKPNWETLIHDTVEMLEGISPEFDACASEIDRIVDLIRTKSKTDRLLKLKVERLEELEAVYDAADRLDLGV